MPHTDFSDSASSLDEVQYDMIDDASDFSNDDRETASLASTERGDGPLTPDDSIVDVDEERDALDASTTLHGSFATLPGEHPTPSDEQTRAENQLLDSYMTDDLETPRQSWVREFGLEQSPTRQISSPKSAPPHQPGKLKQRSVRLLFVSERDVSDDEVTRMCQRLAADLATKTEASPPKAVKLPATPSGTAKQSMIILAGDVELVVEHCVHARWIHSDPHARLYIRTDAREYATHAFTNESDSLTPDLAVYCFSSNEQLPPWFSIVQDTVPSKFVVSIATASSGTDMSRIPSVYSVLRETDIVVSSEDLSDGREGELGGDIDALLAQKQQHRSEWRTRDPAKSSLPRQSGHEKSKWTPLWILMHLMLILAPVLYGGYLWASDRVDEVAVRRAVLSDVLMKNTNSTNAPEWYNVEHLIPQYRNSPVEIRCSGGLARGGVGTFMVSIPPKKNGRSFSEPTSWSVQRSKDQHVAIHRVGSVIDGIYSIRISPDDSYGEISTHFILKDPALNGTCTYQLGNRMLQKRLYDKVTTGISKVVNEDAAIAAQSVKSFTEKVGLELAAGAAASKNVTTQLAVYAARELQLYAHTGASMLEKLGKEAPGTIERFSDRVRRDAKQGTASAQRGFVLVYESVEQGLQTTTQFTKDLIPTKRSVKKSLYQAHERALSFKHRVQGLKKDTNSTSATKEMSLRLQSLFKPSEHGKRAGSFKDIAACVRAEDYRACRREQRKNKKAAKAAKTLNALAKVEEKGLGKKMDAKLDLPSETPSVKPIRPVKGMKSQPKPPEESWSKRKHDEKKDGIVCREPL